MTIGTQFMELLRGKDIYRILMNAECASYTLFGRVLDIGSGREAASYHRFFKKAENIRIIPLDQKIARIDFEQDPLPAKDGSVDMVLAFNCFEHIYRYSSLISEIYRVLADGGQVFGATPVLVGYHPDPKDYWRFTSEALRRIFQTAGFDVVVISTIGRGPCTAAFSQIEFMIPRFLKIIAMPCMAALDRVIFLLKPRLDKEKFALGLFFQLIKK